MEPWEALDVDDSDLSSLLRPCDRRHRQPSPSPFPSPNPFPLQSQQLRSQHRLIPGPAGAVQSAMLHKTRDNRNFSCPEENPVPTQEYIRRAVEDAHEDDDFNRSAWCSALSFIDKMRNMGAVANYTPLSSVKKGLDAEKVDQVVAVIKSCTPNRFGDMMVTLKDPTGTVGASIHRKVFTENEFAKVISVGSVLILQKVSVFSPSQSAHYLNITPRNILKVISKDCGVQSEQNYPLSTGIYVALGNGVLADHCERSETLLVSEKGKTERIMAAIRQNINKSGNLREDCLMEKKDSFLISSMPCNSTARGQNASIEKETRLVIKDVDNILYKQDDGSSDDNHGHLNNSHEWTKSGDMPGNLEQSSAEVNLIENTSGKETRTTDEVQNQKAPLSSKPAILQWTDEQLSELFAMECDDDDFLYG